MKLKPITLLPTMLGCCAVITPLALAQTPLTSGSTVTDSVRKNNWVYYTIQVPSTATMLEVDLVGTNNKDGDLYIKQGANPTTNDWDFRPNMPTSNESVVIDANSSPALVPGATYHIGVNTTDNGNAGYTLTATITDPNGSGGASATQRYRVVWVNDPSTTATVGWEQISGNAGTVYYDTVDHGTDAGSYAFSKTVDRQVSFRGMDNCFARLSGLTPDTNYYFLVQDGSGVSERYYFRTAPDTPQPFTFCAGGDSRNNRTPRQQANRLVGKLRPLFVSFTGDMINSDNNIEWQEWLDDWQETITSDGRVFPILPHRGNHESGGNQTVYNLFDTTSDNYYAINIGGNLMRYYVLNSEMSAGGTQLSWLQNDLNNNSVTTRHLTAGYHKPMRPHQSAKSEGSDEYNNWAQLFYDHGMDLVFESDSHVVKRTAPLMPSTGTGSDEGFIEVSASDPNATIYTGEGCWGAPLRAADDSKTWTLAAGSFMSFDWVQVFDDRIDLRTIVVNNQEANTGSNTDADPFAIPTNLQLWNPSSGTVLTVPGDGGTSTPIVNLSKEVAETGLAGNAGDELLYRITLPEGSYDLDITLTGGTGNADIYVKAGGIPTTTDFDLSSTGADNEESAFVTSPTNSIYYVLVKGTTSFSGASLSYDHADPTIEPVFAYGSAWNYKDDGSDQGTAWRQPGVTETWPSGNAQLGFGDGDEATAVQSGHITYYFRKVVNVSDLASVTGVEFDLLYDDAAVIYINGVEVHRTSLLPSGPIDYLTGTSTFSADNSVENVVVDGSQLVEGSNLIAVEIHNQNTSSSDISFDLSMKLLRAGGPTPPPATNLVHWNLDETSGTVAADSSGNSNDGTVSGATWSGSGVTGGALDFDGVDDRADFDLTNSGSFSVALWAKSGADGQSVYSSVFSNHTPNTGSTFQIDMGNGFQYRGSQTVSFGAAPLNTWVHLVVSCDGSTTKLYYNGQLVQTLSGVADTLFDGIHLGTNRNEGNFFQGSVDDFRFYDGALTDGEVSTLYSSY
ncbi:LamG-like jellyroll fold domain-containing protein [Rubritalea squalenifaciens]|nr:LamG-like jellyroll fold domain-containing protein [Rubritalea squalenifaciens]